MNRTYSLTFDSNNGNSYYLDESKLQLYLLPPLFKYIIQLYRQNSDIECAISDMKYPIVVNGTDYSREEVNYYIEKLKFFIQNHIISFENPESCFNTVYSEQAVEESLKDVSQVVIEMTECCNLRCVYCTYGDLYIKGKKRNGSSLDLDYVEQYLSYLIDSIWSKHNAIVKKTIRINYYGGEPLLKYNEIVHITNFLRARENEFLEFQFGMTTNATLMDEEMVNFFVQNRFQLSISIDGNEYNNSYRVFCSGKEIFSVLESRIDLIRNICPDYFNSSVFFISVLHDRNSVEEINDYLKKQYGKSSTIGYLNLDGISSEKQQSFKAMVNPSSTQKNMQRIIKNLVKMFDPFIRNTYLDLLDEDYKKHRFYSGVCAPFSKKIFITTQKHLLPCEKINFDYLLCNMNENDRLDDIIKATSRIHTQRLKKMQEQCTYCYYNIICDKCLYMEDALSSCKHFMNRDDYSDLLSVSFAEIENNSVLYIDMINKIQKI